MNPACSGEPADSRAASACCYRSARPPSASVSTRARHLSRKMCALPRGLTACRLASGRAGQLLVVRAPPCTCIARSPKQHLNRLLTTSTETGNTDTQTQPLVSSTRSPHSCTIARTLLRYTPHLLCGSKHDVSSVAFTTLPTLKYLSTICRQRRFHSLQSEDRKSRARSDDRHRTRC